MASFDYDVVIIGSGFGGSVAALRAAETAFRFEPDLEQRCEHRLSRLVTSPWAGVTPAGRGVRFAA